MVKMRGAGNSAFVNFSLLRYFCSPSYTPVWSKGGALLICGMGSYLKVNTVCLLSLSCVLRLSLRFFAWTPISELLRTLMFSMGKHLGPVLWYYYQRGEKSLFAYNNKHLIDSQVYPYKALVTTNYKLPRGVDKTKLEVNAPVFCEVQYIWEVNSTSPVDIIHVYEQYAQTWVKKKDSTGCRYRSI